MTKQKPAPGDVVSVAPQYVEEDLGLRSILWPEAPPGVVAVVEDETGDGWARGSPDLGGVRRLDVVPPAAVLGVRPDPPNPAPRLAPEALNGVP